MNSRSIVLSLFLIFILDAQATDLDSLRNQLDLQKTDSMKALVLCDLGYYYQYQDMDSAQLYVRELHELSNKMSSKYFIVRSIKLQGNIYMEVGKYDSSSIYFEDAYRIVADDDFEMKSALLSNMGLNYKKQGKHEEALQMYLKAIELNEAEGLSYGKFICLLNMANTYNAIGQYDNAIKYGKIAVECYENEFDDRMDFGYGTLINNIGVSYYFLQDPLEAINYFKKSKDHNEKVQNRKETARNLTNIGSIYESIDELDSAVVYLNQALEIRMTLANKLEISETLMEFVFCRSS